MHIFRKTNGLSSFLQDPLKYFVGQYESGDFKSDVRPPRIRDASQNDMFSTVKSVLKRYMSA